MLKHHSKEASVGEVTTIGLDLAKSIFQAHGADAAGAVVFRKKLRRDQMLSFFAGQPRCLVAPIGRLVVRSAWRCCQSNGNLSPVWRNEPKPTMIRPALTATPRAPRSVFACKVFD